MKNETYKVNLNKLENLVLVMFSNDTMVVPRESSHFGFYAAGQDQTVVPLQQTQIYTGVSPLGGAACRPCTRFAVTMVPNIVSLSQTSRDDRLTRIGPRDPIHLVPTTRHAGQRIQN